MIDIEVITESSFPNFHLLLKDQIKNFQEAGKTIKDVKYAIAQSESSLGDLTVTYSAAILYE